MCKRIVSLFGWPLVVCLLTASGALSEARAVDIDGWGKFIDPAGDCKVQEQQGIVSVTVPGSATAHDLTPTADFDNVSGPRVLQSVQGDFRIDVNVLKFPRPKAKTSVTKQGNSYVAAGLLVWQDEKTFIRWLRAANGERGDLFVHVEPYKESKSNTSTGRVLASSRLIPDEPTFLRLERGQGKFTFSWSKDGQTWTTYATMSDEDYAEELQVGVGVVNATNVEFAPQFEKLTLDQKK